ncbi:MAG: MaoC family dehydratase N-terminal domain-containing protein [Rhodospirillales bacterium]|jgi:3-methylfumaryl-CoA hydratase|nr:MaoC family dehydratase N-terminal domain-containing protein [Rhodospirillales bacterium]
MGDDSLRNWIGREEVADDIAAAAPLAGLAATLDRAAAAPAAGDGVVPGGHWLFFLPRAPQSGLGPDGHALRGGFLPPVPLPRRMWAGGRLEFPGALYVGEAIRRRSVIVDVTEKTGKSGALVFVVLRHEISGAGGLAVIEEQDLVYREAPDPKTPPPPPRPAPQDGAWSKTIRPDAVMLFRYSALTFNGHRIHYDRPYAVECEGYPGLVVHGPLVATLLMALCRDERPDQVLAGFDFRMVGPLFDIQPFTVHGRPTDVGADLWAADAGGALAAQATATFKG